MGFYQSPFDVPFTVPGEGGDDVTRRGGADLGEGSQKETPNASGIPTQPDRWSIQGAPGENESVMPGNIGIDRTIETRKD
jgi:hypothetical protein